MNNFDIEQKELLIYPFVVPIYETMIVLLVGKEKAATKLIESKECISIESSDDTRYLGSTFQPKEVIYI